jgi:putative restriction endonuclease
VERGLLNEQGRLSGRAQAAVRPISPQDFDRILARGLAEDQPLLPRVGTPDAPLQFDEGRCRSSMSKNASVSLQ